MPTVREFVEDAYQLVSADSPTVPLHGNDLSKGIRVLNMILQSYASTGLMLTVARTETITLAIGQEEVTIGSAGVVPTPDITVGRLANYQSSWLLLDGVTYPMLNESRADFLAAWKYEPLQGLPRFVVVFPEVDVVRLRLYPAPSQVFEFFIRGKFQLGTLTSNDDMSSVPEYYHLYLMYALARKLAQFKARNMAWTPDLENTFMELRDDIVASSEVNLAIVGDHDSLLNGRWAIQAGVS